MSKTDTITFSPITVNTSQLFCLDEEERRFFQATTGIEDQAELDAHIISVQREAYKVHKYPCITNFCFTNLRLARLPGYPQLLELGQKRENPIMVEIGCCFGNDVRKAIADGYPQHCIVAVDILPDFWTMGHKLFKSTPETFPVPFLQGDVFNPAFLEPTAPAYTSPSSPAPKLSDVSTLNELRGHASVVSVCAVFHLFRTEERQLHLARALAGLVAPEPGSMLIGLQRAEREKGLKDDKIGGKGVFFHCPESWAALWDGEIFRKGTVRVDTRLSDEERWDVKDGKREKGVYTFMQWSVTRL